jgi:hypothetical protein
MQVSKQAVVGIGVAEVATEPAQLKRTQQTGIWLCLEAKAGKGEQQFRRSIGDRWMDPAARLGQANGNQPPTRPEAPT